MVLYLTIKMNVNDENGYILPNEEISHETHYVENEKTDNYNLCNIEATTALPTTVHILFLNK